MELTMNLPRNYVEIEEEEMMYLDGGWTISRYSCRSIIAVVGTSINSLYYAGSYLGKKVISAMFRLGGVLGVIAGLAVAYASKNIIKAARGIARGAMHNGVVMSWKWDWLDTGITYKVRY